MLAFLVRRPGMLADDDGEFTLNALLSSPGLSSFFASSSSGFFGFFGAPNALNHAFRLGATDLVGTGVSTGFVSGFFGFSFSFSSSSLIASSLASNSVDVIISSSSISSESLSREPSSLKCKSAVKTKKEN